jgi:uncharacterized protein (DUF952 family)
MSLIKLSNYCATLAQKIFNTEPRFLSFNDDSMNIEPILHLCDRKAWWLAQERGVYTPTSLEDEGFIHCSTAAQLLGVANRFYPNRDDLLVLVIQTQKLEAELRWEPVDSDIFPHLYGALNLEAVSAAYPLPLDPDGIYRRLPLV